MVLYYFSFLKQVINYDNVSEMEKYELNGRQFSMKKVHHIHFTQT